MSATVISVTEWSPALSREGILADIRDVKRGRDRCRRSATNNMLGWCVYPRVTGDAIGLAAAVRVEPETCSCRVSQLFDAHHQRLYRLARRLTPTADDARDLVQETFLRVARSPASVPAGVSSEEAWLVRILINVCRDGWRRKAARGRIDSEYLIDAHPARPSNHEAAFIARTTVWNALRTLAPRRRAAIVLYELEGVGIADIAKLLGISAVTVRWHLSRGRRELARIIRDYGHGRTS